MMNMFIRKTISSPKAFMTFLAFQRLLKVQKYMDSLSNVGFHLSNVGFRLFSLSVFSGCSSILSWLILFNVTIWNV
jgi:hypothetical protein